MGSDFCNTTEGYFVSKTITEVSFHFERTVWPKPWGKEPKTGPSRKIYLWTYDLGLVAVTAAVLEWNHKPIFPSYLQNMVCRNPDVAKWIGLTSTSKLLQLLKLVLNHNFKTVSFYWDRF